MADATITSRSRRPVRLDDGLGGASGETSTVKGKGRGAVGGSSRITGQKSGHAALRTVTSESWDDDFLFQHSSTSDLHLPLDAPSTSSSARPRPPTSISRTTSSSSYLVPPTPKLALRPHANPSLDSLASSAWGSSTDDQDPTITLTQPTPARRHASPSTDYDRSTTPSLSYSTGAATAEELTEAESFISSEDEGGRTSVEIEGVRSSWSRARAPKQKLGDGPMSPPPVIAPGSRWRGGGGSKRWKTTLSEMFGSPPRSPGRRTGPRPREVVASGGEPVVVLGRRDRQPHSSLESHTSQSTNSTSGSSLDRRRPRRLSLDFLHSSNQRKSSSSSRTSDGPPLSPSASSHALSSTSWREPYDDDSATSAEEDNRSPQRGILTPSTSYNGTIAPQGRWTGSQVSFASSASAFGLSQMASQQPGQVPERRRKLVRKREREGSSGGDTVSGGRSPLDRPGQPSESELPPRPQRPRSVTTPTPPTVNRGSVVEVDSDGGWLAVAPFAPPTPTLSTSPSQSKLSALLRRPSSKSKPPVTGKTQAALRGGVVENEEKKSRPPLSLSNILSRSTSSLPLGRRAPSPTPTLTSSKSAILTRARRSNSTNRPASPPPPSPRSPRRPAAPRATSPPPPLPTSRSSHLLHRPSASVETPRSTSSGSFFSRARALSRPSRPSPPIPTSTSPPPLNSKRSNQTSLQAPTGRLNEGWTMPMGAQQHPSSGVSDVPMQKHPPSSSRAAPPKGGHHRPSLSLSSAAPTTRTPSFASVSSRAEDVPRPRTAMGVHLPSSEQGEAGQVIVRRNSLSDLRIPSRITSSQARIEGDLERVKEFARGVDDLKALRMQYSVLVSTVLASSSPSPDVSRIQVDYQRWWEQAETLIDLGDGKEVATKRDRCVSHPSLSTRGRTSTVGQQGGSETETEETQNRRSLASSASGSPTTSRRPRYVRRPSASSMETAMSVEERQKEMLQGVLLNPALKGASLPVRGPPSPRPTLAVLTEGRSASAPSSSKPVPPGLSSSSSSPYPIASPSKSNIRRVSRAGVSAGIKDFLLRLRIKASEELAASVNTPQLARLSPPEDGRRSVSDPTRSSITPSNSRYGSLRRRSPPVALALARPISSSSSEEDWDRESSPPSLSGRPKVTTASSAADRMVLTTEAMPGLLVKVKEVREKCEECLRVLEVLRDGTERAREGDHRGSVA